MSCRDCETAQLLRDTDNLDGQVYVRIGKANVEIVACRNHAAVTLDLINIGLAATLVAR